nr:MAG TPA_asm: hypothetical protein [Caudoviricetes sp.]
MIVLTYHNTQLNSIKYVKNIDKHNLIMYYI